MKLIKIIIIVLCLTVLWFIFWCLYETGENEVYVLPKNFIGSVVIIFNSEDGKPEEYDKNKNRVYEVDSSGILRTRFKFQRGMSRKISYVSEDELMVYLYPNSTIWKDTLKKANNNVYVYNAGFGKDYWFLIGKLNQIDSLQKDLEIKWKLTSKKQ